MKRLLLAATIGSTIFTVGCTKEYVNPYPPQSQMIQFVDEFSDNRNDWNFADNVNDAYGVISNGTFSFNFLDANAPAYYVSKNIQFNPDKNFVLQTRIGSDNNMGLLFGYSRSNGSGGYGYSFTINYNGYYALWDEGGNGAGQDVTAIVSSRTASFVNKNGNWNDVKIEQNGNTWIGYINGYEAFRVPAKYILKGSIGFVVVGGTRGEADYLQANYY